MFGKKIQCPPLKKKTQKTKQTKPKQNKTRVSKHEAFEVSKIFDLCANHRLQKNKQTTINNNNYSTNMKLTLMFLQLHVPSCA